MSRGKSPAYNAHFIRRAQPGEGGCLDVQAEVLKVLDEVLSLRGRAAQFNANTPLLGSIPELDSMAVVGVITGLEERFGITVEDDDLDGATFATVGSLSEFIRSKVA